VVSNTVLPRLSLGISRKCYSLVWLYGKPGLGAEPIVQPGIIDPCRSYSRAPSTGFGHGLRR
jgi:hypothetical protein